MASEYERMILREAKERARRQAKYKKEAEKEAKRNYLESKSTEADSLKVKSDSLFNYLKTGVIKEPLEISSLDIYEYLKPKYEPPNFEVPNKLKGNFPKPELQEYISRVGEMSFLGNLFPYFKKRWFEKLERVKKKFDDDLIKWENIDSSNRNEINKLQTSYKLEMQDYEEYFKKKCESIVDFKSKYLIHEEEAVISFFEIVLERSSYKIDWEKQFRVGYSKDSKELVVEFRLPTFDVVPKVSEYRYVKARDSIEEKPRKPQEIEKCYKSLISCIAIRTMYEVLKSDDARSVLIMTFNGYVVSIDPSTGQTVSPIVISVTTTSDELEKINPRKVDPIRCIQSLSAEVSSSPQELIAVKPIREFNMVDKRFVKEEDIASKLDNRPNLMDLDPFEFENLVSNLFSKMGLETKQTRSSRDGGVDAIAFDIRPILGGKIVIQAKRYKNTVGVSAVRDLYGTMINEGASKGILVSTSSYGPDAFEFAKDKPIELIDGRNLLHFLNEVGIKAKIIMPET